MTFFGHNCKIDASFFVNSFAKLYFARERPFGLPPYQRMISVPFPNRSKRMNSIEKFLTILLSCDKANNFIDDRLFNVGIRINAT